MSLPFLSPSLHSLSFPFPVLPQPTSRKSHFPIWWPNAEGGKCYLTCKKPMSITAPSNWTQEFGKDETAVVSQWRLLAREEHARGAPKEEDLDLSEDANAFLSKIEGAARNVAVSASNCGCLWCWRDRFSVRLVFPPSPFPPTSLLPYSHSYHWSYKPHENRPHSMATLKVRWGQATVLLSLCTYQQFCGNKTTKTVR